MPKLEVQEPQRSLFDLSKKVRTSLAPGLLYPIYIKSCLPGDKVSISLGALCKTYPTLAPIFGRFKLRFHMFFAPDRLYTRALRSNQSKFDPAGVFFPFISCESPRKVNGKFPSDVLRVGSGTLFDYLGFPPGYFVNDDYTTGPKQRYFNAHSFLTYVDIFRNYYANPQEETFYVGSTPGITSSGLLSDLDAAFEAILAPDFSGAVVNGPDSPDILDWLGSLSFVDDPYRSTNNGLFRCTYAPDLNSTFINSKNLVTIYNKTRINVTDDSVTVDQIRTANKMTRYLERTLVAGNRYSEFIRSQFGISAGLRLDVPEYLGSTSTDLFFEDVESTAATTDGTLGELAGRGLGMLSGRNHYYNVQEYGTFMIIASIVPDVDYFTGIDPELLKINMTDKFVPALDRIGFQPLLQAYLNAVPIADKDGTFTPLPEGQTPFDLSIGQQPAWVEYMSDVNRLHGDFTNVLRYWVLARNVLLQNSSGTSYLNPSSYIDPVAFNYAFADSSDTAQNFLLQLHVNAKFRRPISKRLMPNLG